MGRLSNPYNPSHGEITVGDGGCGGLGLVGEEIHHFEGRGDDANVRSSPIPSLDPPSMSLPIPSHCESMALDVVVGSIGTDIDATHHFSSFSGVPNGRVEVKNGRVDMSTSMALPGSPDGGISISDRPGGVLGHVGKDTHPFGGFSGSDEGANERVDFSLLWRKVIVCVHWDWYAQLFYEFGKKIKINFFYFSCTKALTKMLDFVYLCRLVIGTMVPTVLDCRALEVEVRNWGIVNDRKWYWKNGGL